MRPKNVYLGQLLVEKGIITPEQLQMALEEQKQSGQPLGATLISMGIVNEEQAILPSLAEKFGIPFVTLKSIQVPANVLARLPCQGC